MIFYDFKLIIKIKVCNKEKKEHCCLFLLLPRSAHSSRKCLDAPTLRQSFSLETLLHWCSLDIPRCLVHILKCKDEFISFFSQIAYDSLVQRTAESHMRWKTASERLIFRLFFIIFSLDGARSSWTGVLLQSYSMQNNTHTHKHKRIRLDFAVRKRHELRKTFNENQQSWRLMNTWLTDKCMNFIETIFVARNSKINEVKTKYYFICFRFMFFGLMSKFISSNESSIKYSALGYWNFSLESERNSEKKISWHVHCYQLPWNLN